MKLSRGGDSWHGEGMRQISNVMKVEIHHDDAALMLKYLAVQWFVKSLVY